MCTYERKMKISSGNQHVSTRNPTKKDPNKKDRDPQKETPNPNIIGTLHSQTVTERRECVMSSYRFGLTDLLRMRKTTYFCGKKGGFRTRLGSRQHQRDSLSLYSSQPGHPAPRESTYRSRKGVCRHGCVMVVDSQNPVKRFLPPIGVCTVGFLPYILLFSTAGH